MSEEVKSPQERIEDSEDAKFAEGSALIPLEYLEDEFEGLGTIRIHHPSFKVSTELENFYSTEFNRLLMETDYPTINELEDKLRERGSWSDKDDIELGKFQEGIRNMQYDLALAKLQLKDAKRKADKTKLEKRIKELRNEIILRNSKYIKRVTLKTQLFQSTVEKMAERNSQYLKYVKCVTDENDVPIWSSIDEMMDTKTRLLEQLFFKSQSFWSGLEDPLFVQSLGQVDGNSDTEAA